MSKFAAWILLATTPVLAASPKLVVHEWGTFTSFQDAGGATIPGINVDDEPVPKFVHRLSGVDIVTTRSIPATWSQGAPRCHPEVTLRLETPVLYFYPQGGFAAKTLEVRAGFKGGWLTEFYPFAAAENAGFPDALDEKNVSSLHWTALSLGESTDKLPATSEHVWLAPRAVHSAVVTGGPWQQAEKYLFYRGVGRLDAPLVVSEKEKAGALTIQPRLASFWPFPELWVIRVQPDGRVRYAHMPAGEQGAERVMIPKDDPKAPSGRDDLQAEIADSLVRQGLYREEALAMLDTWKLSYFESEGLRVMFVLPRSWTDTQLPLSISEPADITRVMLGRIELVSAYQRGKLQRLLELPDGAFAIPPLYAESTAALQSADAGKTSHADLYRNIGREVPEALQLYEQMGRFRDAWLTYEWNSTRDAGKRARIERIMSKFSACIGALKR